LGLREWWKKRKEVKTWEKFTQSQSAQLAVEEQKIGIKAAKVHLKFQELQLQILKKEQARLKKKPDYVR